MPKIKKTIYALVTLVGTIVGVGFFALPYIASKVGIWTMLGYFLVLTPLVIIIHHFFGEVALRTKDFLRLPSFAEIYLGRWGRRVALASSVFGLIGVSLAYIIIGGQFLSNLLIPVFGGSPLLYALVYFVFGAIMIFGGIGAISKIEFLDMVLFTIILIVLYFGAFHLMKNTNMLLGSGGARDLFLPYGAILFSLWGATLIPETEEMLREEKGSLKKIVSSSIIISAVFYLLFIVAVVFISGAHTSREAIVGLKEFLGNGVITLLLIFGLVVTFTSFVAMGLTLKKVFWYDLKIGENLSWAIACFVPFFLFLLGLQDFIKVIGLVGSVGLGIEGILIILMYRKLVETKNKNREESGRLVFLIYPLIAVLLLGVVYEIIYFIR
ncbi:MAG: hypothetical protein CO002_03195 [Candidatus Portnoybacteria bacterium CG_4_8_14_3_um_filter_44_10]|uniref:Amino acid transporter transmembrane domain-containing protein n=4 Tax=Candidatus Portnoyibacteriota TaxID=1817913 RepID=A0A2H0WWA3_9BACT|nr:MAG: hypothetical protein AUK17_01810 [Parcubacteria group bacterium CG2_30_44_18]PIS16950.1 MAG: hypothetical protein COT61_01245 [Candidatus Portnoybacteria bacterium CG09_land_8_20_14_0_10_44_13]PIW75233.1 MAG: hypothetical protein CO002_03195 [Candidatus Portnoybacteria bacterium CG_4_8_14_3_um_filter_44_10]PIZ69104.1 MAG: hypothetical protein COY11_04945 [Candidatus Portnoybacteria bacterium CG_4_10_14_0_2_um_filter_44_20]